MKRLNLDSTGTTDAGLVSVAKFKKLNWLNLSSTKITDEGILGLSGLGELRLLKVTFCDEITDSGIDGLRQALPDLYDIER